MSKAVASSATWSGSVTNTNTASGSMLRRINQAHAAPSMCTPGRVAHLIGRPPTRRARKRRPRRRVLSAGARLCVAAAVVLTVAGRVLRQVLLRPGRGQRAGQLTLLLHRGRPGLPHHRGPGCGADLVSESLQLLAGTGIRRQRDDAVGQLRDSQPLEPAPDRTARGRRLPRSRYSSRTVNCSGIRPRRTSACRPAAGPARPAPLQRRLGRGLVCEGMCSGTGIPTRPTNAQTQSVRSTDHLTRKSRTAASTAMARGSGLTLVGLGSSRAGAACLVACSGS